MAGGIESTRYGRGAGDARVHGAWSQAWRESHASLNDEQRSAVEHDAGPLIVLAGPGTGKTRAIVHRVAWLLHERGRTPEHVVACTFTVKAARELRARLAGLVGPEMARRLRAQTLHGLGAWLVRRFADRLGLPARTGLGDPAMRARLIKRLVLEHGLFPWSHGAGLGALARRVEDSVTALAERGVLPARALAFAQEQRQRDGEAFASVLGADDHDDPLDDKAARLAALDDFEHMARIYDMFTRESWRRGWLHLSDYILLPVQLLTNDARAAALVRADIRSIVVDEFQDCNAGQIELLRLLAGPPGIPGSRDDICVVGDDDQAIYGFRGADQHAFDKFARIWRKHRVVTLTHNYRSGAHVVAVANACIARAASRFRPDKQVIAASTQLACPVEAVSLPADSEDAGVLAAMIALSLKSAQCPEGFSLDQIAVLARAGTDLERAALGLARAGIGFRRARRPGVLGDQGVQDVMAWVRWLCEPAATWAARRALVRPAFAVDGRLVLGWQQAFARQEGRRSQPAPGTAQGPDFARWLRTHLDDPGQPVVDPAQHSAAMRALDAYEALRTRMLDEPAQRTLLEVLAVSQAAGVDVLEPRARARRVRALAALLSFVRLKQDVLDAPGNLPALWRYWRELEEIDPDLGEVARALRGDALDDDADQDDSPESEADAEGSESTNPAIDVPGRVHLITAHSSKGLEFDTVYVLRVSPGHGFPKTSGPLDAWMAPRGLVDDRSDLDPRAARLDEERRLFYVACTRAKRRLVLMARHKGKPSASATNFFDEVIFSAPSEADVVRLDGPSLRDNAEREGLVPGMAPLIDDGSSDRADDEPAARRAALDRALARVHADIDAALAGCRDPQASGSTLLAHTGALERSGRRMALLARLSRGSDARSLVGDDADLASWVDQQGLGPLLEGRPPLPARSPLWLPPPKAPLRLSYTSLNDWQRCPRCWYAKYVLRIPDAPSDQAAFGTALHRALADFTRTWTLEDSEGGRQRQPEQQLAELLALGRTELAANLVGGSTDPRWPELVVTMDAQLTNMFTKLHDPRAHVLEAERRLRVSLRVDGVDHELEASIDRLDQLPDGGVRIIDYKSGMASKRLLEPAKDDMQLGVYAMALSLQQPHGQQTPPRGVAEYWVLSSGQRGVIGLDALRMDKIRATIEERVRDMLRGPYPKGSECGGTCVALEGAT